jgi:hypothetical protein
MQGCIKKGWGPGWDKFWAAKLVQKVHVLVLNGTFDRPEIIWEVSNLFDLPKNK